MNICPNKQKNKMVASWLITDSNELVWFMSNCDETSWPRSDDMTDLMGIIDNMF